MQKGSRRRRMGAKGRDDAPERFGIPVDVRIMFLILGVRQFLALQRSEVKARLSAGASTPIAAQPCIVEDVGYLAAALEVRRATTHSRKVVLFHEPSTLAG